MGITPVLLVLLSIVVLAAALYRKPLRSPLMSRFVRAQFVFIGLAVAAALTPSFVLLIAPSYSDGSTLLQVNGPRVLLPLFVPVVLTVLPALMRPHHTRTIVCAAFGTLLGVLSFLGGFSIGLFYVPATAFLIVAGAVGLVPTNRTA